MTSINCGIVGYGRSGKNIHHKLISKTKGISLVSICDIDIQKISAGVSKKIKIYKKYNKFLENHEISLVIISARSKDLFWMTKQALMKRKNVIVEKPFCQNINELNEIDKLTKIMKCKVIPFFNFRYSDSYIKIQELINKKAIGDIFLVKRKVSYFNRRNDWQSKKSEMGGIINAAAIHHIDEVINLFNSKPKIEYIQKKNIVSKGDADDHMKLILSFKKKITVDIEVSWAEAFDTHLWELYGTKGAIKQSKNSLTIRSFNRSNVRKTKINRLDYIQGERINWKIKKIKLSSNFDNGKFINFYKKTVLFLNGNAESPINFKSLVKTFSVVEKINRI